MMMTRSKGKAAQQDQRGQMSSGSLTADVPSSSIAETSVPNKRRRPQTFKAISLQEEMKNKGKSISSLKPTNEPGDDAKNLAIPSTGNRTTCKSSELADPSTMTTHELKSDPLTMIAASKIFSDLLSCKPHVTPQTITRRRGGPQEQTLHETDTAPKIGGHIFNENKEGEAIPSCSRSRGEALLLEYMQRSRKGKGSITERLIDANFDWKKFNQPSLEAQARADVYRSRCKKIENLTSKEFQKNFKEISSLLKDIVLGSVDSERHSLFMTDQMHELKLLNVSIPFNNLHGSCLFGWLFDLLVEKLEDRPTWTEYINYVMLPECFIRIYALVNKISLVDASNDMRFGC